MGCPDMTGVEVEDLNIFAPRVLDDFYRYNHALLSAKLGFDTEPDSMTRMMAVLPYVAEHFGLDKDTILTNWSLEYGIMRLKNVT